MHRDAVPAGVVVVAGGVGERPGVGAVGAGVGVRGAGQHQADQAFIQHTLDRAGGKKPSGIISDAIGATTIVALALSMVNEAVPELAR